MIDPVEVRQKNYQILIVDDDVVLVKLLKKVLSEYGLNVKVAYNGFSAIDEFSKSDNKIDLVIMDQSMPKMSGDELAAICKEINPNMPLVLCTGIADFNPEISNRKQLFTEILTKPVELPELAKKVVDILDGISV